MLKSKVVLNKLSTSYGNYEVVEMTYDGRPARLLYGDDESPQSGIALDNKPELLFDYNQRFMEIAASLEPQSVLVIGGGGFTLPTALVERFSSLEATVVELDPSLPEVARKYFNLKPGPRLNVIVGDGRDFLAESNDKYDLIIVDAFSGMDVPKKMISLEAARLYHKNLAPDGVMAINFISSYHGFRLALAHQLIATFSKVFASVETYPSEYSGRVVIPDNLIMVVSKNTMPNLDYLQSAGLMPLIGVEAKILYDD